MRTGVFAKTFAGTDPVTVLGAARAAGFASVQYNLACSGLASMPDAAVPGAVCAEVVQAAPDTGVAIAALSGTYNMIHPDPSHRRDGLRRLGHVIGAARQMGVPLVTLCTGTRDPQDQWRGHLDNTTREAWADLLAEMAKACDLAEATGLRLGIEPELANVVSDAACARRLIDNLRSPALRVVLDPANLFEVAPDAARRRVIAAAVDLLGDRIALAHAKDRHADGSFAAAGTGVIDFGHFVACLRQAGFDGDLVAHGLDVAQAPAVARFLAGVTS